MWDVVLRPPALFPDIIPQDIMQDPVLAADGFSYERAAIEEWLGRSATSPVGLAQCQWRQVLSGCFSLGFSYCC